MFTLDKLHSLDDKSLFSSAINLEAALKNGEHSDIDGKELFVELKLIREFIKESMDPTLGPHFAFRSFDLEPYCVFDLIGHSERRHF